ncbi:unnamed protein product [Spirodela intermedia]|uniref:Uncharacterized protein n=1 Tax=Spirodela intermedia TaxID=51605 RepID=A0A7I8JE90_SPIIN|nr:unnamed protein product [Spirodela intermedia]CAA6668419.1 unnamed protein product [Spirodela intermedia]
MRKSSSSRWHAATATSATAAARDAGAEKILRPLLFEPCCDSPSSGKLAASPRLASAAPLSPLRSYLVIPFSWEEQPGVPRHGQLHPKEHHHYHQRRLPPPPPLRSPSGDPPEALRRKRTGRWPASCSKDERCHHPPEKAAEHRSSYWNPAAAAVSKVAGWRQRTAADRFGFLGLYASCKTSCSVAESTVYVPHSGRGAAAYALLSRRRAR